MKRYFRDPISGLTHLLGAALGVVGLIYLNSSLAGQHDFIHKISIFIFSIALILLFGASAAYHLIHTSNKNIQRLRKLDHIMIYLFMAASFTPICLIPLRDSIGVELCIFIWSCCLLGVLKKVYWMHAPRWFSTVIYLGVGWTGLVTIPYLMKALPENAYQFILAEGGVYTLGALVYALKWPNPIPDHFGFHEIWHLFVLAGAFGHFGFIAHYLV